MTTTKLDKVFQQRCPQLHRAIFGKRYILPQYRSGDYQDQDTLNRQMQGWFVSASLGRLSFSDELNSLLLINYALALRYDRPTLFCERELAEALQRTDLPSDLTVADLNFKWPQLRIILPLNLLTTNRRGQLCSVTYLDMCLVNAAGVDRQSARTDSCRIARTTTGNRVTLSRKSAHADMISFAWIDQ